MKTTNQSSTVNWVATPVNPPVDLVYPPEDIIRIAAKQKLLICIVGILVPVSYLPTPGAWKLAILAVALFLHVAGMTVACQLAHLMKENIIFAAMLTIIPVLNLFAYAHIIHRIAQVLIFHGIRTGIFGAFRRDVQRFGAPGPDAPAVIYRFSPSPSNSD